LRARQNPQEELPRRAAARGLTLWRRVRNWLDPGRSLRSRLLLGFFLAFFVPGLVLVLILADRLSGLERSSGEHLAAVQVADHVLRLRQDIAFRAEWVDRRALSVTEAVWTLAGAAARMLEKPDPSLRSTAVADPHGHLWTAYPEQGTGAYVASSMSTLPDARRDLDATVALGPLFRGLSDRRPTIRSVSIWTSTGVFREWPWRDLHESIRHSGGALEDFRFNLSARFPTQRPAEDDRPQWRSVGAGPRTDPGVERVVALMVPVRDSSGRLRAALSVDVDPRRYFSDALAVAELPGDIWLATDREGRPLHMTAKAAEILDWDGQEGVLGGGQGPERRRLFESANRSAPVVMGEYIFGGRRHRIATARVRSADWILFEGLSAEALEAVEKRAREQAQPLSYSALRRDLIVLFVALSGALLAGVVYAARRISEPVLELVAAAEEIGQGRSVHVTRKDSKDELGRLAAAVERMGRRVERRVETLRRLHLLFRTAYRTTDRREVLARSSEAIAAFTRAERVFFFLHDPDTNRLQAAYPGWNLPEEIAAKMTISVDAARSIATMVFRSGEIYVSNDLERDPYVNRELQKLVGASNGIFCPLKVEETTIGVAVAINRPGGFGPEEADAMTSFADAASLLIRNARLYETLSGTVDELKRASRLKDHFLQNVNHELRTPLTSIVGWTDLFEEESIDEPTTRKGLRQIRHSARLLMALIDDLLDMARLDRGALVLDLKPVRLAELLQRALDTVRPMAEAHGQALILAPLPELPVIRADPLRLQQVLWNLLSNAIKFTPRHGRVILRAELDLERVLISVEDDGVGIPEGELPHVFERFRQVDGSPTRRHPGLGIGLALTRSLVELHGGKVWAESVVGHGSRFTFALPIRPQDRRLTEADVVSVAEE
jgi:signal transduction histidine kinase/HAMP domain-containing protein